MIKLSGKVYVYKRKYFEYDTCKKALLLLSQAESLATCQRKSPF